MIFVVQQFLPKEPSDCVHIGIWSPYQFEELMRQDTLELSMDDEPTDVQTKKFCRGHAVLWVVNEAAPQ